jgi:predicted amidophosphoribosyltransferase
VSRALRTAGLYRHTSAAAANLSQGVRNLGRVFRALVDDGLAALLPDVCPGCGARGAPVCTRCRSALRAAPRLPPPPGVDAWSAAFAYEGVAREIIVRAKYHDDRRLLRWLAREMVAACNPAAVPGVVTWAPASAVRLRERGIDHGQVLARAVARDLHVPCRRLLVRSLASTPQTVAYRAVRSRGPELRAIQSVRGMIVLVVDDVATTGATLRAVASALRRAGAASVNALTATRTPRHHRC